MRTNLLYPIVQVIIFVSAMMAAVSISAAELSISGVVKDAETSRPIANANVILLDTALGAVSDAHGKFKIIVPQDGTYHLQVRFIGYKSHTINDVKMTNDASPLDIKIKPSPIQVEEITISVEAQQPQLGTVLISEELASKNPTDVGAFFRDIPGAGSIKKGASAQDPVIRGFKQNQLNIMFDGGLCVTGGCPSRMDPPTSHVQAEDIDRIEIIKGPFTSRYPQTMGGLVNIVMHNSRSYGEDGFQVGIISGYESVSNGARGRVFFKGGLNTFDLYSSVGMKKYDDYRDGSGETVPSSYGSRDYSIKLGYQPSMRQRLQVSWRQSFARDVLYPALPMDATIDDTDMLSLDYSLKSVSPIFASITAKLYGTVVDHAMDNAKKMNATSVQAETTAKTKTLGYRFEALLNARNAGLIYVGTDFTHLNMTGERSRHYLLGSMAGKTFYDPVWPNASHQTIGLFSEWHKSFTAQWRATAGGRADFFNSNSEKLDALFHSTYGEFIDQHEINPNAHISIFFEPAANFEFSLSAGRGVRSASITELYINRLSVGLDRYEYFGNPTLKAEKNSQIELSHRGRLGRFSYNTSAFYSNMQDYISAVVNPDIPTLIPMMANGVKQFINIDDAYKYGGDIQASYDVTSHISLKGAAAFTLGQNKNFNEPLPEMPPLESRLAVSYTTQNQRAYVEIGGRFADEQTRVAASFAEKETPGFTTYNLLAGFKLGRFANITFGIDNIFDAAYSEHLTRSYKTTALPIYEPGRNVFVNVKIVN